MVIIVFISIIAVAIYLFLNRKDSEYTGNPIPQESLTTSEMPEVDLKALRIDEREEYQIWRVSNKVSLTDIENMIYDIGLNLSLEQQGGEEFYYWKDDGGNYFQYSLLLNTVIFNLEEGIEWGEATLTDNSFSNFVRKYFNVEWDYNLTSTIDFPDGEMLYYAKRMVEGDVGIEKTPNLYQETDYLALKNGKIMSGEIFLTHFLESGIKIPLLSEVNLENYINQPDYPRMMNVRPNYIASAISSDDEYPYMSDEIIGLQETIRDCKALNYSVVYLYKSFTQEYLTPVYRLELECLIEYQQSEYSVPAVAYVNAINPQYIAIPE